MLVSLDYSFNGVSASSLQSASTRAIGREFRGTFADCRWERCSSDTEPRNIP